MSQFNKSEICVDKIMSDSDSLYQDYLENLASNKLSFKEFKDVMKTKYDDLFRNYQSIFNISISNNYDGKRLKNMLILANKVKKSEITEHEASVEVGTELVNNIVKPQLDKAGINSNK